MRILPSIKVIQTDCNNITRIKYQDENGKTHQVATKDDGMKYGGDSGSAIKKKLNEQVNVVGGITDANKLTTEDNLGVVSDGTGNQGSYGERLERPLKQ